MHALEWTGLRLEAIPIAYDARAWAVRVARGWPPGSPAQRSYGGAGARGPLRELRPWCARG